MRAGESSWRAAEHRRCSRMPWRLAVAGFWLWLLAAAGLCGARAAASNFGTAPAGKVHFDLWTVDDGWQPSSVTAIVQSRDGYLWLGTYNGLVRFDGVRFRLFDSSNTPGLSNSRVTSLYEDANEGLWIGHETGELTRLSGGEFMPVKLASNWPGGAIEAISADEHDDLWLVNDNGLLFRLRDGHITQSPGGGSATRKASLSRAENGQLWIAANGLVASLDRGQPVLCNFGSTNGSSFYQRVLPARDGGLWAVANGGLRKFRQGRWEAEIPDTPGPQVAVTALLETSSGALVVGTLKDGLYFLPPNSTPLHFTRTNGLSHDWIRSLCEDREGNLWIGTGGGLDTLRARKVKMLNAPDGWQGRAVLSFAVEPDGTAWVGTEGAGLYRRRGSEWTVFSEAQGLRNLFVWSVLETRRGELFVGTWGGGLFLKTNEMFESSGELSKITAPIVSLFEGRQGELWIGTTAGLYRYENGKITWSAGKEKLVLPDVRAITETADGVLWFGMSGGGVASIKDGTLRQFRRAEGLSSDFVQCLYADPDGTLWIGTSDNGLIREKEGKFSGISTGQGLPSSILAQLVDDGAGNLWIGSHWGIVRASRADLNRCADGLAQSVAFQSYGKAEGLASLTCSGGFQPGGCRTADGSLWFPTAKGLAIIDPANVTTNPVAPPVVIEELIVDGESVSLPRSSSLSAGASPLQIQPGKQRFEIHYTGLSFAAPDKVLFRYRLEGLEPQWMEAGTKRVAPYSYLPPGPYTFHVVACNNDAVWNETGASLSFMVLPWFWQTWWFRLAAVAAGTAAVGASALWIGRRRVRARLAQLERQQAVERERARIARDIHDDLGASLTRITLLSQTVRADLEGQPQAAADLDQIYGTARELTRAMDEIVWAVNPRHDTLDSLVTYLGRFAQNYLSSAGIRCRLDVPLHLPAWPLTAEIRHNVFLAFKEALHNAVKHAHASEVRISLDLQARGFVLIIGDNGCGFELNGFNESTRLREQIVRLGGGNGLLNMRKRLEEVGGRCDWETAPGEGTRVKLVIAVKT
jgi:signal transduction histidine kinase/ligand-binding sensor domain-containing protein